VRYKGSQLGYAVSYLRKHRAVTLVSLMIGGNDLLRCVETTRDGCLSSSEQEATFATIQHNVRRIVSAIRHKGRYHGQLVIVNYPSPFASAFFKASVRELNTTIDDGAKPYHVAVADSEGVFETAEAHSGGDPCQAGLLVQEGSPGKCGLHPSYAGQALMAQAVLKVIRV
jgi:lysophospholipase L1-like esterase